MSKKKDPLESWKTRVRSNDEAVQLFQSLCRMLQPLVGDLLQCQTQKFPPKLVLAVSSRAALHRGERFASVAAVADSVYFDLLPSDDAIQKQLRRQLRGAQYLIGDGFELQPEKVPGERLKQISAIIEDAQRKLGSQVQREQQWEPYRTKAPRAVPEVKQWRTAMCWTGSDLFPVRRSNCITRDTVFARGAIDLSLAKPKGVGVKEITYRTRTGLLELEIEAPRKGQPAGIVIVAAHAIGFDKRAWSFRLVRNQGAEFMPLFVGPTFTNQQPAEESLLKKYRFDRIELQANLPYEDGRAIRCELRENFAVDEEDEEECAD